MNIDPLSKNRKTLRRKEPQHVVIEDIYRNIGRMTIRAGHRVQRPDTVRNPGKVRPKEYACVSKKRNQKVKFYS